jgi:hypothetical protein
MENLLLKEVGHEGYSLMHLGQQYSFSSINCNSVSPSMHNTLLELPWGNGRQWIIQKIEWMVAEQVPRQENFIML